ncbi:MAG: tyrosine-type recombinase/integrase [Salinivirgaceae bacterium]|jgi:integrase|nr:tyrosine-type recombinase/integrase [Salinivirgaceae bacterium]
MAAIVYYIRTTTKKSDPKINIRVRFNMGKKALYGKTPYQININDWSQRSQRVKQVNFKDTALKINSALLNLESFIIDAYTNVNNKSIIDSKWVQKQIDEFIKPMEKKEFKEELLSDFVDYLVDNGSKIIIKKTGKKLSANTLKKYNTTRNWIKSFLEDNKMVTSLIEIDYDFYEDFIEYLTFKQDQAVNTVGKNISILKVFMKYAKKKGYNIDTSEWVVPRQESDSVALTKAELDKLFKKDLSDFPNLEKVRDLFVFGCNTGLRYSDFTSIDPDKIKEKTIESRNIKTGTTVTIPLLEQTKLILEKYQNRLPKAPGNQVFNKQIKKACKKAEIDDNVSITITKGRVEKTTKYKKWEVISSHTARRTFATILYKDGHSHITIMAITGHKSEAAFLKYIKVSSEEHAEMVQEFYSKKALVL